MLVIELNKDIRSVGCRGAVFLAVLESEDRFKVVSEDSSVNGAYLHISHARVIGDVSTPEGRIIDGIIEIYEKWEDTPGVHPFEDDLRELATQIYRYVKDELERQNARSG